MSEFAKIVLTSDDKQVLFYVEPDCDDWIFHQIVSLDGVQADTKMTFAKGNFESNKENAYKALALVDMNHADKIYKSVAELFED